MLRIECRVNYRMYIGMPCKCTVCMLLRTYVRSRGTVFRVMNVSGIGIRMGGISIRMGGMGGICTATSVDGQATCIACLAIGTYFRIPYEWI